MTAFIVTSGEEAMEDNDPQMRLYIVFVVSLLDTDGALVPSLISRGYLLSISCVRDIWHRAPPLDISIVRMPASSHPIAV